jgi:hypothetical protein
MTTKSHRHFHYFHLKCSTNQFFLLDTLQSLLKILLKIYLFMFQTTCDSLRTTDNRRSLAEPLLNVNALADEVNNPRTTILNGQSTASPATTVNPAAEFNPQNHNNAPYWVPRTTLRRFSGGGEFYQS